MGLCSRTYFDWRSEEGKIRLALKLLAKGTLSCLRRDH